MVKGIAPVVYYYAKYIDTEVVNGRPQANYEAPIRLVHNVKRLSGNAELSVYGQRAENIYRAVIPNTEKNRELFKRYSLAYLDGATPNGETRNGDNANFMVIDAYPVNISFHVFFERLPKK